MDRPIFAQLAVAAAGEFDSLAVAPAAILAARAQGASVQDIRQRADDLGVRFTFLDGVSGWLPKWYPTQGDPEFCASIRQRFAIDTEEALALGAELGMTAVVAVGAFDPGALHRDVQVECFDAFCRLAAKHGMRTSLEFIPFWGIPELGDAWDILSKAAYPGAGLVLDTWHMQRGGQDFRRDLALLGEIAASCPFDVQLADACRGTGWKNLIADVAFRGFAGDGSLDVARMVKPLAASGALKTIGPEVFGHEIAALSLDDLGRRGGETTQLVLAATRPPPPPPARLDI
ncbi:sugar phosphate isomerase/epimerase family protein [Sphingobium aquiterrae]|uniref:sugar phosphate isomerase/epimerase family protein n=1 Tax=Sphingobium aquiterrae TaxID=2038656 RepID=UPI003019A20B